MRIVEHILEWAALINESEADRSEIKKIDFPKEEISGIYGKPRIVTHRVSDDFQKFQEGDIVETPWGVRYKVAKRDVINDVNDSQYVKQLSKEQRDFLGKYDKISVLTLESKCVFRKVAVDEAERMLDEIQDYSNNTRFNKNQFSKFIDYWEQINSIDKSEFFGMFDCSGRCLSLCVLKHEGSDGFVFISEIQTIISGYGKPLIIKVSDMYKNMWFEADPSGGRDLVLYYRNNFSFREFAWKKYHFFYQTSDKKMEKELLNRIRTEFQS